jgi:uncharacterized protein YceK
VTEISLEEDIQYKGSNKMISIKKLSVIIITSATLSLSGCASTSSEIASSGDKQTVKKEKSKKKKCQKVTGSRMGRSCD